MRYCAVLVVVFLGPTAFPSGLSWHHYFRPINAVIKPLENLFYLPQAPQIPLAGSLMSDHLSSQHLELQYGEISLETFNALSKVYLPPPGLIHRAHTQYRFVDFFPQPIPQFAGKYFDGIDVEIESELTTVGKMAKADFIETVSMNCWGTVYEVARQMASPTSYVDMVYVGLKDITRRLTHPQFSTQIDIKSQIQLVKKVGQNQVLQSFLKPGDVLLVWLFQGTLIHAAVYLDGDLYFEKRGRSKSLGFGVVDFQEILNRYSPSIVFEWRRFGGSKDPLPPLAEGFDHLTHYKTISSFLHKKHLPFVATEDDENLPLLISPYQRIYF